MKNLEIEMTHLQSEMEMLEIEIEMLRIEIEMLRIEIEMLRIEIGMLETEIHDRSRSSGIAGTVKSASIIRAAIRKLVRHREVAVGDQSFGCVGIECAMQDIPQVVSKLGRAARTPAVEVAQGSIRCGERQSWIDRESDPALAQEDHFVRRVRGGELLERLG